MSAGSWLTFSCRSSSTALIVSRISCSIAGFRLGSLSRLSLMSKITTKKQPHDAHFERGILGYCETHGHTSIVDRRISGDGAYIYLLKAMAKALLAFITFQSALCLVTSIVRLTKSWNVILRRMNTMFAQYHSNEDTISLEAGPPTTTQTIRPQALHSSHQEWNSSGREQQVWQPGQTTHTSRAAF